MQVSTTFRQPSENEFCKIARCKIARQKDMDQSPLKYKGEFE